MKCPKCKKKMRELTEDEYKERFQGCFQNNEELEAILEDMNIFICDNCQHTFTLD